MAQAIITVQGGPDSLPTLLGQAPVRIPTGGKIRPGIMVLTRKAAEQPEAKAIYTQGVAEGRSFEAIEKALKKHKRSVMKAGLYMSCPPRFSNGRRLVRLA